MILAKQATDALRSERKWSGWAKILLLPLILVLTACSSFPTSIPESAAGPDDFNIVYVWTREGGIAGFCDRVIVFIDGSAATGDCLDEDLPARGSIDLSSDEQRQVENWYADLEPFQRENSDPAVADAMTIRITFTGIGIASPDESILRAMQALAEEILLRSGQ